MSAHTQAVNRTLCYNSYKPCEVSLFDVGNMNIQQCCILIFLLFRLLFCSHLCTTRGHETDLMTLPPPSWTCGDMISINISDECCRELAGPGAKTGRKGHGWMWVQLPTVFHWRRLKVSKSVFASILLQKRCPLVCLSCNGLPQPHLSLFKALRDCLITAWLILFRHCAVSAPSGLCEHNCLSVDL